MSAWDDVIRGPSSGPVAASGDLLVRDRNGNWTYALCVVVDDLRHGVDLVVRGEDLLDATAPQIRLGALLGRDRRRRRSPITRSSCARTARSSARPTARPRSASCSMPEPPSTS